MTQNYIACIAERAGIRRCAAANKTVSLFTLAQNVAQNGALERQVWGWYVCRTQARKVSSWRMACVADLEEIPVSNDGLTKDNRGCTLAHY